MLIDFKGRVKTEKYCEIIVFIKLLRLPKNKHVLNKVHESSKKENYWKN